MSIRQAAREFGLARKTIRKMLQFSVPPGCGVNERSGRRFYVDAKNAVEQSLDIRSALVAQA
jgi:hypothetical protein